MQLSVRPLAERELKQADHIMRLAFGTFLGLNPPTSFMGDADYVLTRWRADPRAALAAEYEGRVVGSNFAANWGSIGFFGPLSVHPDLWDKGVAQHLLAPTMEIFSNWGCTHLGLFTFPQSAKHLALYQKFGFFPRFLTPVMYKTVESPTSKNTFSLYSETPDGQKEGALEACRELTDSIYNGMDVRADIVAADTQKLGETVLLWSGSKVVALAVCHMGPDTEAGTGNCYVKFGAVRPGKNAGESFARLLDVCEALAASRKLGRLTAGINTAHDEAYREMLARGFRTEMVGVALHRPNEEGYHRAGLFVIDDWR